MSPSRRPSSRSFDLLMVVLLAILVVGGHILVWADDPDRGLVTGNQLFSIWALPVYIGFLPAAYVLFLWWSGRRRGGGVPLGYRAALIGAALFLLALIAEFAWRAAGARPTPGPEGVLAPSRIALFVGAALMISGPLLSLARRLDAAGAMPRFINSIHAAAFAVALGLLLSLTTLLTGFIHPFVVDAAAPVDQPVAETPTDLYLVPLDGSGTRRLTVTPTEWEAHPAVSVDGTLAYARGQLADFRVYTDSTRADHAVRLDPREVHQDGPVFEPHGTRIAYWAPSLDAAPTLAPGTPAPAPGPSQQPAPLNLGDLEIWLYDADGGIASTFSNGGVEAWSHDGKTLCGWNIDNGSFDIETWDAATGVGVRPVTQDPAQEWGCDFASDDATVYFHSDRDGDWELYSKALTSPTADAPHQLTDDPGIDQWPHLSPDGSTLAFMSSRGGNLDIWLANPDGTQPRNLTNDPALEDGYYGFAWLPDGSGLIAASAGRSYAAPSPAETQPLGVGAIVLNALIVVGVLLFGLRLVGPMVGLGTIVGLINGLLAALVGGEPLFFISVLAAGMAADLVFLRGAATTRRLALNMAGATAFVLVLSYFLLLTSGVSWGLDLVLGSIILSSVLAMGLALIADWGRAGESAESAESGESSQSGATVG